MTRQHSTDPDTDTQKDPDKVRARWTLRLALVGGSVFGLMDDADGLLAALRHRPYAFHYGSQGLVSLAGILLGGFLLTLVVTVLAPRRFFLWGAAALGITLAWSHLDRLVTLNWPGLAHDLAVRGWRQFLPLLVPCGLLSLLRFLTQRWQEAETRRLAEEAARRRLADEAQATVWPPPIRTDGHYDGKTREMK